VSSLRRSLPALRRRYKPGEAMDTREICRRLDFLSSRASSLSEACEEVGRDEDERRCRTCPVRRMCRDESRWLVRRKRKLWARLN
jgi:hypothetical protein